jgi:heat shock protein HtpX
MAQEHDNFRQFQRINRRKTVELVAIFLLVYCFIGLALDFILHTLRVVNHHLAGMPVLTIAAAAFASAQALRAYFSGSSVLLDAVDAQELASEISSSVKARMAADIVDEMALAARIAAPRAYLMEDPAPNAFAAGRDPAHSVICVTRGLIDQLDREELQGVIAHEIAHIRDHDTRLTQMATVMVGGFALVCGSVWRSAEAQRHGEGIADVIPGFRLVGIPLAIVAGIGWLFSKPAAIALSREREYLADASAVEFTRNPTALIRALEHIARIESPLKRSLRGLAPLFIVDPLECGSASWTEYLDEVARIEAQPDKSKEQRDAEVAQFMARGVPQGLFHHAMSSHPPIHDRIVRLRGLLPGASGLQESQAEIGARRKAAEKTVKEITQTNPEAMAAMLEAMLAANPAQQLMRALGENAPPSESEPAQPPQPGQPAADPHAVLLQELLGRGLGLPLDSSRLEVEGSKPPESPMAALLRGQPVHLDPAMLRTALAAAMAASPRKPVPAPANPAAEAAPSKVLSYMFWLVIALCAGAIAAALALR